MLYVQKFIPDVKKKTIVFTLNFVKYFMFVFVGQFYEWSEMVEASTSIPSWGPSPPQDGIDVDGVCD